MNLEFDSLDEALYYSLKYIISEGNLISPRGKLTKEVLGYSYKLMNPRARLINIESRKWNQAYALGELCWHLNASDNLEDISYYSKVWSSFSTDNRKILASCYGKKIFSANNRQDQWHTIIDLLKRDNETRRAVISLSNNEDVFGVDVPCVTSIQFLIRDNKLNCITNMRSNDIIWGMCYDVFFITFLQEMLSKIIGCELGWYIHNAGSLHIYEKHLDMAEKILEEGLPSHIKIMDPMNNLDYLQDFLDIERAIRKGSSISNEKLHNLPEYWKRLIYVLIKYNESK